MPKPENVIGKGKRFSAGDQPTIDAARKGGKARQRQVRMQALMKGMLKASPETSESMLAALQRMGIDTDDPANTTVAALMTVQVLKQALAGDLNAIQMAFEMAGESVDARSQIEREKLALEKKKLSMQGQGPAASDIPRIIITTSDEPLT